MEFYDITEETQIILYGFSSVGRKSYENLVRKGYRVIGFIDCNAGVNNVPEGADIYTPDNFFLTFTSEKEIVIIVCLNNGMQHEQAVTLLMEHGFEKIIFIPMDPDWGYEYMENMQKVYAHFIEFRYKQLKNIPKASRQVKLENVVDNKHIVRHNETEFMVWDEEFVTFLCDVNKLFSANEDMIIQMAANEDILERTLSNKEFIDKPISMCKHYINLYDYILKKSTYPDLYLSYFGKDFQYNERLLRDRLNLYECYEKKYEKDIRMFYIQPATVKWNEKGYFNLWDGMHRIIYLYYVKGHMQVPIKASQKDYKQYRESLVYGKIN